MDIAGNVSDWVDGETDWTPSWNEGEPIHSHFARGEENCESNVRGRRHDGAGQTLIALGFRVVIDNQNAVLVKRAYDSDELEEYAFASIIASEDEAAMDPAEEFVSSLISVLTGGQVRQTSVDAAIMALAAPRRPRLTAALSPF